MPKLFIKIRKHLWLPFRWKWQYREKCLEMELKTPHEILDEQNRLRSKLSKTEQDSPFYNVIKGKIELLNWVRNG